MMLSDNYVPLVEMRKDILCWCISISITIGVSLGVGVGMILIYLQCISWTSDLILPIFAQNLTKGDKNAQPYCGFLISNALLTEQSSQHCHTFTQLKEIAPKFPSSVQTNWETYFSNSFMVRCWSWTHSG